MTVITSFNWIESNLTTTHYNRFIRCSTINTWKAFLFLNCDRGEFHSIMKQFLWVYNEEAEKNLWIIKWNPIFVMITEGCWLLRWEGNENDSSKHFIFAAYCFLISVSEKRHKQSCLKKINIGDGMRTSDFFGKSFFFVYFICENIFAIRNCLQCDP